MAYAHNNLGVIAWNRGDGSKAIEHFQRAVAVDPHAAAPRNNLAAVLRADYAATPSPEAFARAEAQLRNVLAMDSTNRLAHENLARLYYDRGRLEERSYLLLARLVVTQANRVLAEAAAPPSAELYNILGLVHMANDDRVEALRAFEKAVKIDPRHAAANMNVAMIAIEFRDYARAEKSLSIAAEDPRHEQDVETYLGLGVARRGLGRYQEAHKAFETARELAADDPRPLYDLGILHQEHIATAVEGFDAKPYRAARRYFDAFASEARGHEAYATAVADARHRIATIDELFEAVTESKRLQAEVDRQAAALRQFQAAQRQRLLELERRAKAAADSAGERSR